MNDASFQRLLVTSTLLFLLTSPTPALAGNWSLLPNSPPAGGAQRHDDLTFINVNTGWLVNGNGDIYSTTDGGVTWSHLLDTGAYNRCVAFTDSLHGVVGYLNQKQGTPLSVTGDSGATWQLVSLPAPVPLGLCGLYAASGQVVYGVGAFYGSPTLVKTIDNGTTWTTKDMSPYCGALVDCCFWAPDSGIAVGSTAPGPTRQPVVLLTTDGGDSWSVQWSGTRTQELCWKISFPRRDLGFVSLENLTGTGASYYLQTTDGGLTWEERLFRPTFRDCQGIGFVDEETGWIGGWGFNTEATQDGGVSWGPAGFGLKVNRFRFLGPNVGYACGDRVYRWNSQVTGVAERLSPPGPRLLEQNSPNPFGRTTRIAFRVEEAGPVTLELFDLQGRRIRTVFSGFAERGPHEVAVHAGDIAAGVYAYRLTTPSGAETRRMWVVR